MRNAAETEGVKVNGVLWVLDELVAAILIDRPRGIEALKAIRETMTWLPEPECERRLRLWGGL